MRDLAIALALTLAVQAMISTSVVAPAVLAPVAQSDVGLAASSIGIFTALIYVTAMFSAPLGGTLVARYGAIRVSQYCLILAASGLALCSFAFPAAWAAGALLIGCGYGPLTPASSEILVARTPQRVRNLVMSIRQSGVPVGGALAGALVPLILLASDWQSAALAIAALCMVCMFGLQPFRDRYDRVRRTAPSARRPSMVSLFRLLFAYPELRQGALASFAYGGMQWCLASFLVVFLTERAQLSLLNAGFALSAAMIGGIVGRLLWGIAADRIGSARTVLGALGVVMALSAFVMSQVTADWPFPAVVVVSVIYGATAVGWNGVYVAEIARIVPVDRVALATGASLAFTYFGVVVMPFAFWLIVSISASYTIAYVAAGMLTLVAAFSYFRRAG